MLLYLFLPLLISWLFKKFEFKRIYLTYIISGLFVVFISIGTLIMRTISILLTGDTPDTTAFALGFAQLVGGIAITLLITLFFQYIFNKTMGISKRPITWTKKKPF